MIFNLAYGKTGLRIELSDKYRVDTIEPEWVEGINDQELAIARALNDPYYCPPLRELASAGSKAAVIFSDITRATPYNIILPALLSELKHIARENIVFFCANGTHRKATEKELTGILGEEITGNYRIVQNYAGDPDMHKYVGTTSSGNAVFLNSEILDFDLKILTGFIEPHFFAGFSGGPKALVPGMASIGTIRYNHSIAHLSDVNATWGVTSGNPLWEEMMEAAELVPGLFLLNVALNRKMEITGIFAGGLRKAHEAGCGFVRESAMRPVSALYDIVITSNSGYPLDLNIYQTVKGMSAAAQIVKEGGSIIMAAECWDGIPSGSDYERILSAVNNTDELMDYIRRNEEILNDTWQIYYQALIQKKASVYLYSGSLDDFTVRRAQLNPTADIGRLTDELVSRIGPQAKICILPEGPQTIPYLKKH